MATKPKPKAVSKKTPTAAASKKASAAASKKVAVKKVASKKVAAKKVTAKKVAAKKVATRKVAKKAPRRRGGTTNQLINLTVPLGYTIGTLGAKDGVATLTIGEESYALNDQTNFPVCLLFPTKPTHARDDEYRSELQRAMEELVRNVRVVEFYGTCCEGHC